MIVGCLRRRLTAEELAAELAAFEEAGCQRIYGLGADRSVESLEALLNRLGSGDVLVVWSLTAIADSLQELMLRMLMLDGRDVGIRALTEGFDTTGSHRAAARDLLAQLRNFHLQSSAMKEAQPGGRRRRAGRPRCLSQQDVVRARALVEGGISIDEAARQLRVSRATLYRYLDTDLMSL